MPSALFLDTQGEYILPMEREMKEENNMRCKRLKPVSPTPQCVYVSVPESSTPLGLTLRKTPSFLDLVDSRVSHSDASFSMLKKLNSSYARVGVSQSNGKAKASNFSASLLQIGSWVRVSRYDGELVAKCYFAKRKLVWEVLDDGLKRKIELQWSDIAALKATCEHSDSQTLEIELLKRPLFFREINPQPRKHTLWKATNDFTDGQASTIRRHFLQFPQGTLQKHIEKLFQLDDRLFSLSKKPYPTMDSAFFGPDNFGILDLCGHSLVGLEGQRSVTSRDFLESESSYDYAEQLHCFTLSRKLIPHEYSTVNHAVTSSETLSRTLGASTNYLGHGASISTSNIFPNVFVPLPSFVPNFNTPNSSEGYYNVETSTGQVQTDHLEHPGATVLHKENLISKFNINSTMDFEPNYWISEIQTNQNLANSSHDSGFKTEADRYLSRFSYVGASDNLEDYNNYIEFSRDISGTTTFPVFIIDDEATSSKIEAAGEWTSWT